MQKLPFPEIEASKAFQKSFNDLVRAIHKENVYKSLCPRNVQMFYHGHGWRTHSGDESAKEISKMELHTTEMSFKFSDTAQHNLSILPTLIESITENMHSQLMRSLYSKVQESTEISGNVVSATEEGSLQNAFLAMLKKIEFGVTEDGKVSLPEIHLAPNHPMIDELRKGDENFNSAVEHLMEEKSAAALSREKERLDKFKIK